MQWNVIFVCTGNLCRSPMAEGIFRHLCKSANLPIAIKSAGFQEKLSSIPYHPLSMEVCGQHQIELLGNSKVLTKEDLAEATHIFALDESNAHSIFLLDPQEEYVDKVYYLREFSSFPAKELSIPDPMGKTKIDFEQAFKMILDCCTNLKEKIINELPPAKAFILAERNNRYHDRKKEYATLIETYKANFEGKNCLLLGCQEDSLARSLARIAGSVLSVDSISRSEFEIGKNLEFRQLKPNKLSTIEKTFDFIICFDYLDYIFPERIGELMEVLKNLLNEKGIFLMTTRGESSAIQCKEILTNYYDHHICTQINSLPASLLELFSKKEKMENFLLLAGSDKKSLRTFLKQQSAVAATQKESE